MLRSPASLFLWILQREKKQGFLSNTGTIMQNAINVLDMSSLFEIVAASTRIFKKTITRLPDISMYFLYSYEVNIRSVHKTGSTI